EPMSKTPPEHAAESRTEGPAESWRDTFVDNAVVHTLVAMVAVTLVGWIFGSQWVALAAPILHQPWTVLTSVYAHASVGHLLGNALVIATAGTVVAYATTTLRFHAFVIATGVLAGLTQILLGSALGWEVGVLGISGAGFALLGYVIASNRASARLSEYIPRRVGIALAVLLGAGLTILFGGANSAHAAHFAGAVLGLAAGRNRLLAV
ncbi:MAG: rhomboid family intramembrane serine protease, partial [Halobacteriales archaeon]